MQLCCRVMGGHDPLDSTSIQPVPPVVAAARGRGPR
jgi:hypothetical protein